MKKALNLIAPMISLIAIGLILIFALLCFLEKQPFNTYIQVTQICSILWFLFAPWRLIRGKKSEV